MVARTFKASTWEPEAGGSGVHRKTGAHRDNPVLTNECPLGPKMFSCLFFKNKSVLFIT